jgi:hypothetical protein
MRLLRCLLRLLGMMRRALVVFPAILVVFAGGCNRLKLAYGWADTYVEDQVTDYLDLTDAQEADMSKAVDGYFAWHRRTILPRIAKHMSALADATEAGKLDEATFGAAFDGIDEAMRASVAQAIPPSAALLATQDDKQIDHFAAELAEREADLRKEDAKPVAKKIATRTEQAEDFLEDFVGSLTDAQEAALKERAKATIGDRSKMWLENRHFHTENLIAAMRKHNGESAIEDVLEAWWLREGPQASPAHAASSEAAMKHLKDGMWEFLATTTPEQKTALAKRLRTYVSDLVQLAHES